MLNLKILNLWGHVNQGPQDKAVILLTNKITGDAKEPIYQYKEESDSPEITQTARKMNVAYFIAKNSLRFTNFESLLMLLKKEGNLDRGKDIGKAYHTDKSCG